MISLIVTRIQFFIDVNATNSTIMSYAESVFELLLLYLLNIITLFWKSNVVRT